MNFKDFFNTQLFIKINYLFYFFIFTYRLDVHLVATHHYPKDAYHCELCPKKYCYRPSLLRHRAIIHGEYRKYPCENCSKVSCTCYSNNLRNSLSCHFSCFIKLNNKSIKTIKASTKSQIVRKISPYIAKCPLIQATRLLY